MPTFIDGLTEPAQLYYCDGDGNYIPFTRIEQATIIREADEDPACVAPSWTQTGELCFTVKLTKQSSSAWKKLFRPLTNKLRRRIRTAKRAKEKARRERLRGGERRCLSENQEK